MGCSYPLKGYSIEGVLTPNGKKKIFWLRKDGKLLSCMVPEAVPCGQCRRCRHAKALEWTIRCVHEASLYSSNNCFITLTFNDQNLNKKSSLKEEDFVNFIKRLRKYFNGNEKSPIRYYHCGEYGEGFSRPHHHAILFNLTFPDLKPWKENLYRSDILERCWSKQIKKSQQKYYKKENNFTDQGKFYTKLGYSSVGQCNFDTIAYCARYVIKKITGKLAPDHYQGRLPEYNTMSKKPGLARAWYEKFKETDVFPRDFIALKGKRLKVPKYYSKCYELTNPEEYGTIRDMRITKAKSNPNNHPDRLKASELIQISRDKLITRNYEKGNL